MKRFFAFTLIILILIQVSLAAEPPDDIQQSINDMMDGVFNIVSEVVPQIDSSTVEYEPDSSDLDFSDTSSNLAGTSNLLVVQTPSFSPSDLGAAVYKAILEAEAQQIDQYSTISDISISPLYNLDSSNTPIPAGTLRAVLTSVIGPYSPVVVQYQYTNGTNTAYLREILPDYQWMISAAIFALVLYCVFRLWGAIICKR